MRLTLEDIKRIIIERPNKDLVDAGIKKNKHLRMHMYGHKLENFFSQIEGFEDKPLTELRTKYAKSNKHLFSWLFSPVSKIYTANGGSLYLNLPEQKNKKAFGIISNVRNGMSARKWTENNWQPHNLDDPFGLLYMEVSPEGYCYPTYKAITSVHDYQPSGSMLDYVAFVVSDAEKKRDGFKRDDKLYRVVDDYYDYYVKRVDDEVEILYAYTFPHTFGHVPAMRNSDLVDPDNEGGVLSFADDIIELADEYLLKGSIKITHEFLHAYPKYWEYADDCEECKGTGRIDAKTCKECAGSGKAQTIKVSRAKLLGWPQDKDTPQVTPHVGGYIEPSETYHKMATAEMELLKNSMYSVIWGTEGRNRVQTGLESNGQEVKTATEVIEDLAPLHKKLAVMSAQAEKRIKFIIDHVVMVEVEPKYEGSSVNLGRRYLTESPDTIWKRYEEAKKSEASVDLLNELYIEYLESKYSGDPMSMDILQKLMQVQPFFHFTIDKVRQLGASEQDYKAKLYYSEWLSVEMDDSKLIVMDVKALRQSLYDFAGGKELFVQEPDKKTEGIAA